MDLIHIVTIIIKQKTISMLKIARPVSFLLLSAALCSSGTVFAANETATPKVGISQQQKSLKGTVNDVLGPVAGASVVVKGTTNGTVTDMDGNFVLEVNSGDVLQISFIGYVTQEIKYTGQATLTVNLMEDTQKLEEVVVVGYGTQKKVNMTGAVAQIDSKALENRPVQNVSARYYAGCSGCFRRWPSRTGWWYDSRAWCWYIKHG